MNCRPSAYWSRANRFWRSNVHSAYPRRTFSATPRLLDVEKPWYITTPIFYPNSDPHIGHLYSTVVADIFTRYALLKRPSRPVVFVTGTDEHGAKIQKAAHDQGLEGREQEFCDRTSMRFRELADKSNLKYTRFIRTTEPDHAVAVQHLWVSRETRNVVEWSEEDNYKFRLSDFRERLLERYNADNTAILFHEQLNVIRGVLAIPENVNDISISRPSTRLKWGITVPDDSNHVIYVWLEALAAYLTAVGYPWHGGAQEGFTCGWPPDVQVIGKDILRFHAIYFPAFLMALDLPLPKILLSHAHWTMNQMKMSKSIGNVMDPFRVLEEYETDVVRYYLARVGGKFRGDSDWSETQLVKHHQELFSLVGNQLARAFTPKVVDRLPPAEQYISTRPEIFTAAAGKFDADMVPRLDPRPVPPWNSPLAGAGVHVALQNLAPRYQALMDKFEIAEALEEVVKCLRLSNYEYSSIAPWQPATSLDNVSRLLSYTRETLRICGILMQPFIPAKAGSLLDALGVPMGRRALVHATLGSGERPGDAQLPVQRLMLFRPFNQSRKRGGERESG